MFNCQWTPTNYNMSLQIYPCTAFPHISKNHINMSTEQTSVHTRICKNIPLTAQHIKSYINCTRFLKVSFCTILNSIHPAFQCLFPDSSKACIVQIYSHHWCWHGMRVMMAERDMHWGTVGELSVVKRVLIEKKKRGWVQLNFESILNTVHLRAPA